jgi:hypothetical protein
MFVRKDVKPGTFLTAAGGPVIFKSDAALDRDEHPPAPPDDAGLDEIRARLDALRVGIAALRRLRPRG